MFSVNTGQYAMLRRFLVQPVLVDALHDADHLAPRILTRRRAGCVYRVRPRALPRARERNPRKSPPRGRQLRCRSRSRRVPQPAVCPWLRNNRARRTSTCAAGSLLPPPALPSTRGCRWSARPSIGSGSQSRRKRRPEAPRSCRGSRAPCGCHCSESGNRAAESKSAPFESSPDPKNRGRLRARPGTFES